MTLFNDCSYTLRLMKARNVERYIIQHNTIQDLTIL